MRKEYWIVGYFPDYEEWRIILRTSNKAHAELQYKDLKDLKGKPSKIYYHAIKHKLIKLG